MRIHQLSENDDIDTGQDYSSEKRALEMFMPIIMNIVRKIKRGVYDHKLAPRLWQYLVDQGAKKYVQEFGGTVRNTFPKRAREELASDLADEQYEMIKSGEYSIATGYDPKKGE